ncbi:hypothetical protein PoB_004344000 [Plakobranchus ocellatus]|uniref:Uncharacterized protein n=1 Tax=Plakobranchus ocellatus TaxID=259542 RepID=A0AAV4BCX2_9GAST|nr:hypothetical protein PoB_004344000 [Plakobranchus ocellatus]
MVIIHPTTSRGLELDLLDRNVAAKFQGKFHGPPKKHHLCSVSTQKQDIREMMGVGGTADNKSSLRLFCRRLEPCHRHPGLTEALRPR